MPTWISNKHVAKIYMKQVSNFYKFNVQTDIFFYFQEKALILLFVHPVNVRTWALGVLYGLGRKKKTNLDQKVRDIGKMAHF